ncbi:YidB family protein [Streptomyces sp. NPDC029721]|uniref:YidB family protein n=1 Tax=Streptomyces sp. NPDC029721 TaxID=3157090 RepID=UPI0033FF2C8B
MTNEDAANAQPTFLTITAESLAGAGLESQVGSWIGDGPNEAISAAQIVAVVGEDQLAQAAEDLEREPADLAADPAARLPGLVEAAAPNDQTASDGGSGFPGFQVRIAPTSQLTLNDEVAIDGSVTLTVHYL